MTDIIDKKHITKVFALGGLEEIGKNTYCIEHNDEIIILDAGVKFPRKSMVSVDAIIPDYTYLQQNNYKIKALIITHGHEDHIGGIPYLLRQVKIPVIYAPELAAALIADRLKEHRLTHLTTIKRYSSGSHIKTANFHISFFAVNHSIPDAFGVAVETPNGKVISTGDYKFDWTPLGHKADIEKLSVLGQEGVKLLMADSTNSEFSGYTQTEIEIVQNLKILFMKSQGRILISTFASNVHRIQKIIELAFQLNRKILVLGRSLDKIISIIRQMGHLKIRNDIFIKAADLKKLAPKQTLIICTGSQGETMAALSRLANNSHAQVSIIPGDTVILSSSAIPGNKMEVEKVVNLLIKRKAIVHENSSAFKIHTSGHAAQEEQKLLLTIAKPTFFMPMHGDYRMLQAHANTAMKVDVPRKNIFVCSNGDQINIYQNNAWIGKRIPADAVYVDGNDMSGKATAVISDREIMAQNGVLAVVIAINFQQRQLLASPKIICRGSFYVKKSGQIIKNMIQIVNQSVQEVLDGERPTFKEIKNSVKDTLSPYIYRVKKRNPIIIPLVLDKL